MKYPVLTLPRESWNLTQGKGVPAGVEATIKLIGLASAAPGLVYYPVRYEHPGKRLWHLQVEPQGQGRLPCTVLGMLLVQKTKKLQFANQERGNIDNIQHPPVF
ncbi:hypothetical protein TWF594_005455 [Orbilia oligospora]|nr:hypothetical protein TWF594_005455 [Orbilia oligospora]